MVRDVARSLWLEERAPDAPERVWRDWLLVGLVIAAAILEGLLRDSVVWRPFALATCVGLAFTLLWRRTHPLAVVVIAFGSGLVLTLAPIVITGGYEPVGLYTMIFIVLLPYSLLRWGSGREVTIGLAVILLAAVVGIASDYTGVADAIGAVVFLSLPVTLGALVRYWTVSTRRELEEAKLREREQLARELHDTIAHHVSAIAVRAQAGRVLSASQPTAAADALDVIEEEASRALEELRSVVGGLRDGEAAPLSTQPGLADLGRLAEPVGDSPRIEIDVSDDLGELHAAVETAIFRIVQESITNAVRHAAGATRIDVRVDSDDGYVRLTVHDDGDTVQASRSVVRGYGLVGMTERASILGGTLEAGPSEGRGWTVCAMLPKTGSTR